MLCPVILQEYLYSHSQAVIMKFERVHWHEGVRILWPHHCLSLTVGYLWVKPHWGASNTCFADGLGWFEPKVGRLQRETSCKSRQCGGGMRSSIQEDPSPLRDWNSHSSFCFFNDFIGKYNHRDPSFHQLHGKLIMFKYLKLQPLAKFHFGARVRNYVKRIKPSRKLPSASINLGKLCMHPH